LVQVPTGVVSGLSDPDPELIAASGSAAIISDPDPNPEKISKNIFI